MQDKQYQYQEEFRGTWSVNEFIITISDNKFYMIIPNDDNDSIEFTPVEIILDDIKRDLPIQNESVNSIKQNMKTILLL